LSGGTKLADRYELGEELGRGGMATVHRAHDHVLGRDVAVKIIRLAKGSDELAERFLREARLVAQLDHPNIVPVYDFHRDGDAMFYVMPVVEGLTLADVLEDGPLELHTMGPVGEQVAAALAYSHVRGVVHRDIKPANVLLAQGDDGQQIVRLTDYGIAVASYRARISERGMIIGTPGYLSPEQVDSDVVDGRSDVYSLGAVLYECITGELPIDGTGLATFRRVVTEMPRLPSLLCDDVPKDLERMVMQCLEKDPAARPQSASEIIQRMRAMTLASHRKRARLSMRSPARRKVPDTLYAHPPDSSAWVLGAGDPRNEQEAIGDRLLMEGSYKAARDAFEAAHATRVEAGDADTRSEAEHMLRLANVAHKLGSYDEALAHCHNGLALLGDGLPMLAARLAASAGLACTSAGRFDDAADWIGRALDQLEEVGFEDPKRPFVEAMIRRTQGNMLVGRGRPSEAIGTYAKSLALLDQETEPWEHSIALYNSGEACTRAGDYDRAMDHLDEASAAKSQIGDRWGLAYVHAMRAQIHLDRDDVEAAAKDAATGLDLSRAISDPKLCAMNGTLLARVHLRRGEHERAEQLLESALDDAAACDAIPEVIEAQVRFSELLVQQNDLDLAADSAHIALDLSAGAGSRAARGSALVALGCVDSAAGRFDSAARRFERAAKIAAQGGNHYRQQDVDRARKQLEDARASAS
jgi:tetratricopeptide (TPR) repeat protein/tRNA A-37 threonylcarbamoyl transferase component Bud32